MFSVIVILISITGLFSFISIIIIRKYLKNYSYFAIVPMIGGICFSMVFSSLSTFGVYDLFHEPIISSSLFIFGILLLFFFFTNSHSLLSSAFSLIIPRDYVVRFPFYILLKFFYYYILLFLFIVYSILFIFVILFDSQINNNEKNKTKKI